MAIGISAYNMDARELTELARAADELGFESLWLGEHIVLPVGYRSEHPTTGTNGHRHHAGPIVDPATNLLDPLVALAGCAAVTSRIHLATGVYLVALRAPLVTARMMHTVDQLSAGRFRLGAGAGWLEEEFAAVGVPFEGRGARMEQHLAVIRKALSGGPFEHDGARLQLCERPAHVPIILGGNTERALRRAARLGDGWFASGTPDLADACRWRDRLVDLAAKEGRDTDFPVYVRIPGPDPALARRYHAEGIDHLLVWADQLWPAGEDLDSQRAGLARWASELGVGVPLAQ